MLKLDFIFISIIHHFLASLKILVHKNAINISNNFIGKYAFHASSFIPHSLFGKIIYKIEYRIEYHVVLYVATSYLFHVFVLTPLWFLHPLKFLYHLTSLLLLFFQNHL